VTELDVPVWGIRTGTLVYKRLCMSRARRIFSIVLLIFGAVVVISSFWLDKSFISYDIGPAIYPRILGVIVILLSVMMFIRPAQDGEPEKIRVFGKKFFLIIIPMMIYILMLKPVGFIVSTMLAMILMIRAMGEKRIFNIVLYATITPVVLYFMFSFLLHVPLPKGILSFIA
jgi:putative tricarboxylic transport membrane protein